MTSITLVEEAFAAINGAKPFDDVLSLTKEVFRTANTDGEYTRLHAQYAIASLGISCPRVAA
jgi:hypothetical protein